jgi:hypothetical protein
VNARFAGVASRRIAADSRRHKTRHCLDPPAIWFHSTARNQAYSTIDWIDLKRKQRVNRLEGRPRGGLTETYIPA